MKRILVFGAVVISLLVAGSAQAFEFVQPDSAGSSRIEAGQSINDTVLSAGQTVDIRGPISKDLFAAGGTVSVDSPVGGNVVVAGGTVSVDTNVTGGLIVFGGTVKVDSNAVITGDVMVFGGTVDILGTVTGNVQAFAGSVSISGTVTGNVKAQADKVLLGDSASIGGSLTGTVGTALDSTAGSHVKGTLDLSTQQPSGEKFNTMGTAAGLGVAAGFLAELFGFLTILVTGLALILLTPKFLDVFRKRSHSEPLSSGLTGLAILVGAPVVFVLCMVFFITIPLGIVEVALLTVLWWIGNIGASLWVGDLFGTQQWSPLLTLAVGGIVLGLVGIIPFVGMLLQFIAWLVGMGSVSYILWHQVTTGKGK